MIVFTIPYIQIQFYGGAIIIEIATKGAISWQLCALMFYLVMIIYLWAGGLRAVAWADVFYGVLIFFGMIAGGMILITEAGGVDHTFSRLIQERPDLILLPQNSQKAGISMWIGMFILMPIGAVMGPQMWIRMFATKERKTFYIMPLLLSLATIAYLGSMFAGSAAVFLKTDLLKSTDTILPLLLVEYAPGWLMAVVMCCGAAACLSTANSDIHAVSALLTLDIYRAYARPKSTEKHTVFFAKASIIVYSAAAYLSLILSNSPDSIVLTGFTALSGMAQLAVPVYGALAWKKSNSPGAICGLLTGVLFTVLFAVWRPFALPLPAGLIGLILNAAVFILCGLFLPHKTNTTNKIALYKRGSFEDFTND
jgi:SSS family solute:Na+ symporter